MVNVINALENSPIGKMRLVIAYEDSDGRYDHVLRPIVNQSPVSDDTIGGPGSCGSHAKQNYVDHRASDQSSILRFIDGNWNLGRRGVIPPT